MSLRRIANIGPYVLSSQPSLCRPPTRTRTVARVGEQDIPKLARVPKFFWLRALLARVCPKTVLPTREPKNCFQEEPLLLQLYPDVLVLGWVVYIRVGTLSQAIMTILDPQTCVRVFLPYLVSSKLYPEVLLLPQEKLKRLAL